MKRIRLPAALLIAWLLLFYGTEWLSPEVQFASAADILLPSVAVLIVLFARLQRLGLVALVSVGLGLLLALKQFSGSPMAGAALPLTLIEGSFLVVTVLLAYRLSRGVAEFEQAVVNMTITPHAERRARQAEVYREVRRARFHQRPLALMVVRPDAKSARVTLDRIVTETQAAMARQYLAAGVARALRAVLDDYQLLAWRHDYFLVVVPEGTSEAVAEITRRVQRAVNEQVGVDVQVGAALMPADAATFEGLLRKATDKWHEAPRPVPIASQPSPNRVIDPRPVPGASHGPGDS